MLTNRLINRGICNDPWRRVAQELQHWHSAGQTASFWVRDDDASSLTDQFFRLDEFARRHDITVGLAIIPNALEDGLAAWLGQGTTPFYPMCHGFDHTNHARRGWPTEFSSDRPVSVMTHELNRAHQRFSAAFKVTPTFVPPYNRIASSMAARLPDLGFEVLSHTPPRRWLRFSRLSACMTLPFNGLFRPVAPGTLDVHVEPIEWSTVSVLSLDRVIEALVGELQLRRKGYIASHTPIGFLMHHLVHDADIWSLSDEIPTRLKSMPAVCFPPVSALVDEFRGRW